MWSQEDLDSHFRLIPHVYADNDFDMSQRYNRAYDYARDLLTHAGMDVDGATAFLSERLKTRHWPGWTDDELRSVIEDARLFMLTGKFSRDYVKHNALDVVTLEAREYVLPAIERVHLNLLDDPEKTFAGNAVIQYLSTVEPEDVNWLWPNRIAIGKLTVIAGDPGRGKSFMSLDMAARVTQGAAWPDGTPGVSGTVLLLTAEDGLADTIRPRLDAAGADCNRVLILKSISQPSSDGTSLDRQFTLKRDLDSLAAAIKHTGECKLVIIDPLSAYLGDVNNFKDTEVRNVLTPLAALAEQHQVAVLVVGHLTKDKAGETSPMYRASGSLAIVAAARAFYVVADDKNDSQRERRFLLPVKNNLGDDKTGLAYRIVSSNDSARIEWESEMIDVSAVDALAPEQPAKSKASSSELSQAIEWLKETFADQSSLPAKDVEQRANEAGIGRHLLYRAKDELGITHKREGFGGRSIWTIHLSMGGDYGPTGTTGTNETTEERQTELPLQYA